VEGAAERKLSYQPPAKLTRVEHIAGTVAFVNGVSGNGKTMLAPIIGSLARVELMRFNYHLEHICQLRYLNLIDDNVAVSLASVQIDLDLYNSMMSRETNFRFRDLSSAWKNCRPWRYFVRLFGAGDAAVISRIREKKPILHLVTHSLLGISHPLFKALGDRLRILELVRHPLYLIKQWRVLMTRDHSDPRVFYLCVDYHEHSLPWFAHGWEELYLRSNLMDRSIYAIRQQWRLAEEAFERLSDIQKKQVLFIPFERFVTEPDPFVDEIVRFLGTETTRVTRRVMKSQNVPRRMYAEGIDLGIYKRYGWEPPSAGATEQEELAKRRDFVASEAAPEALQVLDELSAAYEAKYLRA